MKKALNILFLFLYMGICLMPRFLGETFEETYNHNTGKESLNIWMNEDPEEPQFPFQNDDDFPKDLMNEDTSKLPDSPPEDDNSTENENNETSEGSRGLLQECQFASPQFFELLNDDPLKALLNGKLHQGGLSYHEAVAYAEWLTNTYKEDVESYQLGETLRGLAIMGYRIGGRLKKNYLQGSSKTSNHLKGTDNSSDSTNYWDKPEPFPEVLFTSLHHPRESCSISTLFYTITKLLQDGAAGHTLSNYILNNRELWIIPIINGDGFLDICLNSNLSIRKNRRFTCNSSQAISESQGVDLNRNYPFNFKFIPNGCDDEYGGYQAFSEPETQAIRNFIGSYKPTSILTYLTGPLKFILHLHTYGDFWTHPFNCCPSIDLERYASMTLEELQFSLNITMGNAKDTLDYIAYGEADDWAMKEHQIISISPEVSNPPEAWSNDEKFWPPTNIRQASHTDNYPRFIEVLKKAGLQANFHAHMMNEPGNYSIFPVNLIPTNLRDMITQMMDTKKIFSVVQLHISNTGLSGSYGVKLPIFIQFACQNGKTHSNVQDEVLNKYVKLREGLTEPAKHIYSNHDMGCTSQPNITIYSDTEDFIRANSANIDKNSSTIWSFKLNSAIEARTPEIPSSPTIEIFIILEFYSLPKTSSFNLNICLGESQLEDIQYCQCGSLSGSFDFNPNLISAVPTWIHSPANIYSSKEEQLCVFDNTLPLDFRHSKISTGSPFVKKQELTSFKHLTSLSLWIILAEIIVVLVFLFCFYYITRRLNKRFGRQPYTKLNRDMSHESFEIGSEDGHEMLEIPQQIGSD